MNSHSLIFHSTQDIMRLKQIASLKTLDYDVKEVKNGTEYHIRFLVGTQWTVLQIHLPSRFPKEKPKLFLSPRIRHEWLSDSGQILHAPLILNYSETTDLSKLVQSVIEECKKYSVDKELKMNSPVFTRQLLNSSVILSSATTVTSTYLAPLPPFIPELESLTLEQLESLSSSDSRLADFVESLPLARTVMDDVEQQMNFVSDQAQRNINLKSDITDLRSKLIDSYSVLNKEKERWSSLSAEHAVLSQRYVPSNIEASLHQAASAAEEQSEEIAEKFLAKEMDVEAFILSYTSSRTVSNTRKTKEDILHKQLEELQRLGY